MWRAGIGWSKLSTAEQSTSVRVITVASQREGFWFEPQLELHLVPVWVSFEYSSFFPLSKDIGVKLLGDSKLAIDERYNKALYAACMVCMYEYA